MRTSKMPAEQMEFLTGECDDARVLLTAAAGHIETASVIAFRNNQYELDKVLSSYRDAVQGMSRMLISLPRCFDSDEGTP